MQLPCIAMLAVYYFLLFFKAVNAAPSSASASSSINGNSSDYLHPFSDGSPDFNSTLDTEAHRFSILTRYGVKRLDTLYMLRNSVEVMAELAQRGYHTHMTSFRSAWPFDTVMISIDPVLPSYDVPNHLAIRCLWWAIYFVATSSTYKSFEADCKWDNVILAQVRFSSTQRGDPAQIQTTNETGLQGASIEGSKSMAILNATDLSTKDGSALGAEQVDLFFEFYPQDLRFLDVYIVVLGALSSVAKWPRTDAVSKFSCGPYGVYDARITFDAARTIRARPPYYEYSHVIETLRRLPPWFTSQGRWTEVGIGIKVDRIWLASAILKKSFARDDPDTPSQLGMPVESPDIATA